MRVPRRALALALLAAVALPTAVGATAAARVRASARVAAAVTTSMPLVRLHLSAAVDVSALPRLSVRPSLATAWRRTGPLDVEAVVTGSVAPMTRYVITVPTALTCARSCAVAASVRRAATALTNPLGDEEALAELGYLPLTFTPAYPGAPGQTVPGSFTWTYPSLPSTLTSQWSVGQPNVLLTGAMMAFQDQHHLIATGVEDAATLAALDAALTAGARDPAPYDYVVVTEGTPETLTLYVRGVAAFHTLVNTGIPYDPTQTGTYPVYLRFVHQVMTGFNPDGSYYADPVTWVSYFHGGDALHQFYRATYGWPQSLGCVEMTMPAAQRVWPYTAIGTLVTVRG
ncbi:MAG TPA: L,D-transpeptidase [Acidimicrobiales bacterium]|nr:L,D-transpeptidase [Acidimicrobiales bacterium]